MTEQRLIVGLILSWLLGSNALACDKPADVTLPDGKTATADEMRAADLRIRSYMSEMRAYQNCLELEADERRSAGRSASKLQRQNSENEFVDKHNAALEDIKSLADQFQRLVDAYEARNR